MCQQINQQTSRVWRYTRHRFQIGHHWVHISPIFVNNTMFLFLAIYTREFDARNTLKIVWGNGACLSLCCITSSFLTTCTGSRSKYEETTCFQSFYYSIWGILCWLWIMSKYLSLSDRYEFQILIWSCAFVVHAKCTLALSCWNKQVLV